jgi:hypothetical protein
LISRIFCNSVCWIHSCYSWSTVVGYFMVDILPILSVGWELKFSFSTLWAFRWDRLLLSIVYFCHITLSSDCNSIRVYKSVKNA